jgi:hypothetical protein
MANIINETPNIQWMGIEDISRTNFLSKTQNGILQIWPYSRRFKIALSPEITSLQVCRSPYCDGFTIDLRSNHQDGTEITMPDVPARCKISNNMIEVFFPPTDRVDYNQVASKRVGMWPIVRRLLTEARDRTKPILSLASAR